jgi:hypothetical protein
MAFARRPCIRRRHSPYCSGPPASIHNIHSARIHPNLRTRCPGSHISEMNTPARYHNRRCHTRVPLRNKCHSCIRRHRTNHCPCTRCRRQKKCRLQRRPRHSTRIRFPFPRRLRTNLPFPTRQGRPKEVSSRSLVLQQPTATKKRKMPGAQVFA